MHEPHLVKDIFIEDLILLLTTGIWNNPWRADIMTKTLCFPIVNQVSHFHFLIFYFINRKSSILKVNNPLLCIQISTKEFTKQGKPPITDFTTSMQLDNILIMKCSNVRGSLVKTKLQKVYENSNSTST